MKNSMLILLFCLALLSACCSTKPVEIASTKVDTLWLKKTVYDTVKLETFMSSKILDTVKVLVFPRIDSLDTNLRVAGNLLKLKLKKKNTEQKLDFELSALRVDSNLVKTITKTKHVYEAYSRPWFEYFIIVAIYVFGLISGYFIKVFSK